MGFEPAALLEPVFDLLESSILVRRDFRLAVEAGEAGSFIELRCLFNAGESDPDTTGCSSEVFVGCNDPSPMASGVSLPGVVGKEALGLFRFIFVRRWFDQRPCIDLLRALGPFPYH